MTTAAIRIGFSIEGSDGQPLAVLVFDDRTLHAAGCRRCWWVIYDRPSFTLTARALRDHLRDAHSTRVITFDLRGHRPSRALDPIASQVATGWGVPWSEPVIWRAGRKAAA